MRKAETSDSELKELLKAELASFKELDAQKKAMWESDELLKGGDAIQAFQLIKAKWQDSADEIKHLHRRLYPNFPRGHACSNCGCDTLPVAGSNAKLDSCIACGQYSDRWSL